MKRDLPGGAGDPGKPKSRRVFAYHEFSWRSSQDVYQLHPEIFKAQLAALQTASYGRMDLKITFDDAHHSQVGLAAPLLEQAGLLGLFFAPAAWVGARVGTAAWSELRALASTGHSIGSHGETHTLLTHCTPAALQNELVHSRQRLEDGLGMPVTAISMPGGRWNAAVAAACLAAGYRELYTSEPASTPARIFSAGECTLAIVGRLVVRRTMSLRTLSRYAAGDHLVALQLQAEYAAKQALKLTLGDGRYQAIWRRWLRSPVEPATEHAQFFYKGE